MCGDYSDKETDANCNANDAQKTKIGGKKGLQEIIVKCHGRSRIHKRYGSRITRPKLTYGENGERGAS